MKSSSRATCESFGGVKFLLGVLLVAWSFAANVFADGGDFDPAFDIATPRDIDVTTTVLQADGKILFAGGAASFSTSHKYIERANSDGSLDSTYFSIIYPKALAATALTFTIEQSSDLVTWSVVSPTNVILADDGVTQTVKAQVPINGATKMFLRLRVSH